MLSAEIEKTMNKHPSKPAAVIFGASQSGQCALEKLQEQYRIVAFADNAATLVGTHIDNIPVIPPESIVSLMPTPEKVFIASEFFEQIQRQLINDIGLNEQSVEVLPTSIIKPLSLGENESTLRIAESILLTVCRSLQTQQVPYHIDAGTLLGIYRDGGLIPWDDDLDIAVSSEFTQQAKQALENALPEINRLTKAQWQVDVHYAGQGFGAVQQGDIRGIKLKCSDLKSADSTRADLKRGNAEASLPMLDIFFKYIEGDTMDYVLSSRGLTMPSKHLLKTETIVFCGELLAIPSDVEEYLTRHYGDWKTPVRDWHLGMLQNATVFE